MADVVWYYLESETPTGPFPWARLVDLSKAGVVKRNTYVRSHESDDWVHFGDVMDRAEHSDPRVPLAVQKSTNEPLLGSVSELQNPIVDANGWASTPVAPWRRYGARMLDTIIHGISGVMVLAYAWYSFAPITADKFFNFLETPGGALGNVVVTSLLAAIVGGIVVGATGTSLGKSIFGIKIVNPSFQAIGIGNGLKRESRVWFSGLGLGIPIITLFTMVYAYKKLHRTGTTSWDARQNIVLYRPSSSFQSVMNALGIGIFIALFALLSRLEQM